MGYGHFGSEFRFRCMFGRINNEQINIVWKVTFILVTVNWTIIIIFVRLLHIRAMAYYRKMTTFRAFLLFLPMHSFLWSLKLENYSPQR